MGPPPCRLSPEEETLRRTPSRPPSPPPTSSTSSGEYVETHSAAETEALGARLAERLEPGDVVVVSGEVGAGKTTLIRGACRALGIEGPVTSPTFTIGHRYEGGRLPVSHLDLYRLGEPRGRGSGSARRLPDPDCGLLCRVAGRGRAAAGRPSRRGGAAQPRGWGQPCGRAARRIRPQIGVFERERCM